MSAQRKLAYCQLERYTISNNWKILDSITATIITKHFSKYLTEIINYSSYNAD